MKEQFVPYELSLKLKELGFDEECFMLYIAGCFWGNLKPKSVTHRNSNNINDVAAPLWQQAFDWFRNNYNMDSIIEPFGHKCKMYNFSIYKYLGKEGYNSWIGELNVDYNLVRQVCLEKLIELCSK